MNSFDTLKKIFANYKSDVDALETEYRQDVARDLTFNDKIIAERAQRRNEAYGNRIDVLSDRARTAAAQEIGKLKAALNEYVTTSTATDKDKIQTLSALLAAGVELTGREITAFADGAGYAVLRMLAPHSNGRIIAPDLSRLEQDLKDIKLRADALRHYRGPLLHDTGGISGLFGQDGFGSNATATVLLENAPAELDEMAGRWSDIMKEK